MSRKEEIRKSISSSASLAQDVVRGNAGQPNNQLTMKALIEICKTLELLSQEVAELQEQQAK